MTGKLIFFDIDGTLLNAKKEIPPSTTQAIRELKQAGHEVAIATGRGPFFFKDIRERLEIDSFVSYNGQYVVWRNQPIYRNPIRQELLQALTAFADSFGHPLVYMDAETMRSSADYHVHIEESIATLQMPHPEYDPAYYIEREIYQSLLFCSEVEEQAYRERFPELEFVRWHPFALDVMPSGGSKAKGIERIIERLGINKEEIYAFGDYLNDIEMLEFAGYSVAMGNAPDVVKRAAKFVTRDVEEDGIRYGLELVGLLRAERGRL